MKCPICSLNLEKESSSVVHCLRCGDFEPSSSLLAALPSLLNKEPTRPAFISHLVRRLRRDEGPPNVTTHTVHALLEENEPPSPAKQVENLIVWLGENLSAPGERVFLRSEEHRSVAGSLTDANFQWLLSYLVNRGLFDGILATGGASGTLSFEAWAFYSSLLSGEAESRVAFMAMPFGNEHLDNLFLACFKPAAKTAGFDLIRLDERPSAGSIDDRLRVEIRRARFLVADLTDGNHGAYWEAGFAEGLGKPVIYTCEAGYFQDPGTHFDTNHHHTVVWSTDDLPAASQALATTIRATLPEEAVLGPRR